MARFPLAGLAIALVACVPNLRISGPGDVRCSDGVCPLGTRCAAEIARCVPSPAVDTDPPTLSAVTTAPRLARRGTAVIVRFDVSEALGAEPLLWLTPDRPFAPVTASQSMYEFEYITSGDEPEADLTSTPTRRTSPSAWRARRCPCCRVRARATRSPTTGR